MKELLTHLLQSALLVAVAYAVYKTVFARGASHSLNRFVLLLMVVLSFVLPVCTITIYKEAVANHTANLAVANNIGEVGELANIDFWGMGYQASFNWLLLVAILYFAGVAALLAYRLLGILQVKALMRKAVSKHTHNGVEVLLMPYDVPAFSFGNKIILSESDYRSHGGIIIGHELIHIQQRHSADLVLINLALSLQWFNPFMWLLRRELVLTHEFCADRGVIQSGIDAKKYQYLLISKSAGSSGLLPVVNHFGNSGLHKRIKTMRKKSSKLSFIKLLVVLPLVCLALVAFADTKYNLNTPDGDKQEPIQTQEKEPFYMPFQGRINAPYGKSIHPINKKERMHIGADIVVSNDTVRAPYSGTVTYAGDPQNGYGNKLVIAHADGLETTYAHLARFLVKKDAAVKGGDPIAIVGNTGRSTGKHLHLECRINDELVDPEQALPLSKK